MNRLIIALLAGALAFAGLPASALELPDYGSKNFSPPSDTTSHFANESEPVSARTADTTENDWSAVDAIAPQRSAAAASSRTHGGRYGRHASTQRHGKYGLGKPRNTGRAAQSARSDRGRSAAAAARTGNRRPAWAAGTAGTAKRAPVAASKTT